MHLKGMDLFGSTQNSKSQKKDSIRQDSKRLPDLTKKNLTDDILFNLVMKNTNICCQVLSIVLNKDIIDVSYNEVQQGLMSSPGYKSVRLDCFAKDVNGDVYNVEMQSVNNDDMTRRSRFYQGAIDVSSLYAGREVKYRNLPNSYIIFITNFDVFNRGRYKYEFENICIDDSTLRLNDGARKIFLNLKGRDDRGCTPTLIF